MPDIAADANTARVGGLSPLGALVMVTVVLAPLYAFSHAWGWLLNWQDVLTRPGPEDVGICARADLGVVPVVAAAIAMALFLSWWTFQAGLPDHGPLCQARLVSCRGGRSCGLRVM